jgi:3-oxoadipate enol-lactonase
MPFLALNRCKLYYEIHGSGPALVFAHGLGGNHLTWWQQISHFQERYTCISFAHRGFGLSEEEAGGPGPDAFVDDLESLVNSLGLSEIRLVAQSMGGWTSLGYAIRHPLRVRGLLMACTTGSLLDPELECIFRGHEQSQAEAKAAHRGIHPACGERMMREQPELYFLYNALGALSPGLDRERVRGKLMTLRTLARETLRSLTMPVFCIAGDEDIVIPRLAVEVFARMIPGARFFCVERAGHSVYWERALVFNRLVDEFLEKVDGKMEHPKIA